MAKISLNKYHIKYHYGRPWSDFLIYKTQFTRNNRKINSTVSGFATRRLYFSKKKDTKQAFSPSCRNWPICAMVHANRNVCGVYPSIWGGKRAENTPSFSLPLFSFWEEKNRRKSCCFRLMLNYIWSNQAYIFQWWNKIVHRIAHELHSFTCVYRNGNYHWRWSHFFYIF